MREDAEAWTKADTLVVESGRNGLRGLTENQVFKGDSARKPKWKPLK
jgi:hypothetical protein